MTIWQHPQGFPTLNNSQVHVWRANLALSTSEIEELSSFLSADEMIRANKFRFVQHKHRFMAARGILRQLLGNYLNVSPCSLTFTYSDRGKPRLTADSTLQFNISHSEAYALLGFTQDHLIGVDLEYQKPMTEAVKIAQRFFSPREFKILEATPPKEQVQLFFRFWTAKEAYLKAIGTGLSGSLAEVEVVIDETQPRYRLTFPAAHPENTPWSLYPCIPETTYLGAIAINSDIQPQQISYWHWSARL
jgi:4'-phosphopantetheinyl transferase